MCRQRSTRQEKIWYPTIPAVKNLHTILISELLISMLELLMDRYLFGRIISILDLTIPISGLCRDRYLYG